MHSARVFQAAAKATVVALAAAGFVAMGSVVLGSVAFAQMSGIEGYRNQVRVAPMDPQAGFVLGRALLRAGKVNEATQELKRVWALPGAKKPSMAMAVQYELARCAMARKDMYAAVYTCRHIAQVVGGEPLSHACAAEAYNSHRRASEALFEAEKAQAIAEGVFEAKVAEGVAQEMSLDDEEAELALRDAVKMAPERAEGHLALGRYLAHNGKRDEGIAILRRAVEMDPTSPDALYELGRVLPATQESLSLLERATKERERFAIASEALASQALAMGRLGEARGAAEAALAVDPHSIGARLVLGQVAFAEGRNDEAIAFGKKVIGLSPANAKARLLVGDAQVRRGDLEPAVETYSQAFGIDRNDPTPLVKASDAARRAGKLTTARAFADKATREFPKSAAAWVALGDALAVEKDMAGARTAYDKALRADGSATPADVKRRIDSLASIK